MCHNNHPPGECQYALQMGYVYRPEEAAKELVAVMTYISQATRNRPRLDQPLVPEGVSTVSAIPSIPSLSHDDPVPLQGDIKSVSLPPPVNDCAVEEEPQVDTMCAAVALAAAVIE